MFEPSMHDQSISVTRGYNMAFGVLSKQMLELLGN
jgi:tubulin-specific chaperone D